MTSFSLNPAATLRDNGALPPTTLQRWPWRIYRGVWQVLGPVAVPVWLGIRAWRGKEDPLRLKERHGVAGVPRPHAPLLWVHAASVGEANAILPLVRHLLEEQTEWYVLMTTGTRSSAQLLSRQLPPRAIHQYIPLDHPNFIKRFLRHTQRTGMYFT